ncbi:cell division protein FtsH, partial [Neisseria meningitidis]|nr:cell division protein FtsH [Neisseria meningitidis]
SSKFVTKLPVRDSEDELRALREKDVQVDAQEERASLAGFLIAVLPYVIFIGLWIFLFRQIQSGGNKAFSFGKSKAKLLTG